MFGIFKKKQKTALDHMIHLIYGDNPPAKSVDLERAITIAHEDLLAENVPISDVRSIASGLAAGPMPHSTYDLAVATSLSFFQTPALFNTLAEIQLHARLRVLNWMKEGKVAPGVLKIFENTLYKLYKPTGKAVGAMDEKFDEVDRILMAKFSAFKNVNADKTLHHAAKMVRDFIVWQHNFASTEMPIHLTEEQKNHAERIERAFLLGASSVAAAGFSIADVDEALFMLNIVGMYKGLRPGDAENEVAQIIEAGDVEKRGNAIGAASMTEYLLNGKSNTEQFHLAALQRECFGK